LILWFRTRAIVTRLIGWSSAAILAAASAFVVMLSVWVSYAQYFMLAHSTKGGMHASNTTFGPLNPIVFAFDHLSDPHGSVPLLNPDGRIPLDWWHGGPSALGVAAWLALALLLAMTVVLARRSTFGLRSVRPIGGVSAWPTAGNAVHRSVPKASVGAGEGR
jgi:hypothetical protein